jgi:hypothetical protein
MTSTSGAAHRRPRRAGDAGSATAELAVSLPALLMLLAVGLAGLGAIRTQIECVDAAREAARTAARGDQVAPQISGATVTVTTDGDLVRATVVLPWSPLGRGLPGFDVTATSVAAVEPS